MLKAQRHVKYSHICTRFAPSPTGLLHRGHAYSAMLGFQYAQHYKGAFHLRIDDIDAVRAKSQWETAIYQDLEWLGLNWVRPVRRQSNYMNHYKKILDHLVALDLCYPCGCTRADIRAALSAPHAALRAKGTNHVYPGTCRPRSMQTYTEKDAIRLNMDKACDYLSKVYINIPQFCEIGASHGGMHQLDYAFLCSEIGDIVLGRKDTATIAYHIAVVIDDAAERITHVVRGEDLFSFTSVQIVLQCILDLPTPIYFHHRLLCDKQGKRLAKRNDSKSIRSYKEFGLSASEFIENLELEPLPSLGH